MYQNCSLIKGFRSPVACRTRSILSGFTMIELLISIAIFAVIGVSMFVAFTNFINAKERADEKADRLKEMQRAFYFISRDFVQIAPRPIRNELGDEERIPSVYAENDEEVEFTRAGWNLSPFSSGLRSELQRVKYRLEDDNLVREHWMVLDRANDDDPEQTLMLADVTELSFRFIYRDKDNPSLLKDTTTWPPAEFDDESDSDSGSSSSSGYQYDDYDDEDEDGEGKSGPSSFTFKRSEVALPAAIEVKVTIAEFDEINRFFLVADEYRDTMLKGDDEKGEDEDDDY